MGYADKKWAPLGKTGLKLTIMVQDDDWKKLAVEKCTAKQFPSKCIDLNERFGIPIVSNEKKDPVEEEKEFAGVHGRLLGTPNEKKLI